VVAASATAAITKASARSSAGFLPKEEPMIHRCQLRLLLLVLCWLLGGCGGGAEDGRSAEPTTAASAPPSTAAPTSTSAATTATAGFAGTLIEARVRGDQVQVAQRRVRVTSGERVRIRVDSDAADEVHVHGYDLTRPVGPGNPATIEFTAELPGVFEVELEQTKRKLVELEVR
jgi:FtsP/CotA-like multicopper oxidase with cupredoxin domain